MTEIKVAPIEAAEQTLLGFGINQITGERVSESCVEHLPDPVVTVPPDHGDDLHTIVVSDAQSYSELMSTAANMNASGVSWSASAAVSFLRERASGDTAVTMTWIRNIRTQDRIADWTKARISADALQLLKSEGADAFVTRYGTHCIIGIAFGASFAGYSRYETASIQEKETFKASISASASLFGTSGKVSDDFQREIQSSNVHTTASQATETVGTDGTRFDGLDINAMTNAVVAFKPSNPNAQGISGAPIALICVSWDEFADIKAAVGGTSATINLIARGDALSLLSDEYAALTYVMGSATQLVGSNAIIPAYIPLLRQIAREADHCRQEIASLSVEEVAAFAVHGMGSFMQSDTLKHQVDRIAAGYGQIQVSYALDGAFGDPAPAKTITHLAKPGGGEQTDLGSFIHDRPQGNDRGDQILSLRYTFDYDANGVPFIGARMHYQDPYAPEDRQQLDFGAGRVLLTNGAPLSYTAAWPDYPWNQVTITLVPPTS